MTRTLYLFLPILWLTLVGCQPQKSPQTTQDAAAAQVSSADVAIFPNITEPGLDREPFSLNDEIARHEITIVDFWASWCGPCRQEAPNLVATYGRYKDKGLGVVGVSLDNEFDAWAAAVRELGLTWPQVSELRGWDDGAAQALGVRAIPHTVVVSKDGKILARELRGDDLDAFVAKQLGL